MSIMSKKSTLKKGTINEFIRMLSFMKKRKWIYIIGLIGGTLSKAVYNIISAFINKNMINAAVTKDISRLPKVFIMAAIALLMACILNPLCRYVFNKTIKKSVKDIREKMFSHMEDLPIDYFEKHHSGDTISRLTNDVNSIEVAYGDNIWSTVLTGLIGISSAIAMFWLDVRLALFMMCLSVISTKTNVKLAGPIRKVSDQIQSCKATATQYIGDMVSGFRVIKMLDLKSVSDKYLNENDIIAESNMKKIKKIAQLICINHVIGTCSFVGVFIIGSFMVYNKTTDFGTITAILSLQNGVTYALSACGEFFADLQESLSASARVFELLDKEKEHEKILINGISDEKNMINIKNLDFQYESNKKILDNININIGKGKSVALVGASGGGKSTITKLLLGFYPINHGEISINNKPLSTYNMKELRELIAYVPQDAFLFDGTIEENILYGKENASKEDVLDAAKMANAHNFIIEMPEGYKTQVGERGNKLSGGQRQRIAIARALLKDAPILLLDEATSALDTESELLVQEALNNLMKGRTTLAIAHRLSTIKNSDQIYVLEDGSVKEKGNHQELLNKKGLYYNLCKVSIN